MRHPCYNHGVDFSETISPEGRRSRTIYNALGELITKQTGLDAQGNITANTHVMNMGYDAFGRLVALTDNDGLNATQRFGANGLLDNLTNNRLGVASYFYDDANRVTNSNLCAVGVNPEECISTTGKTQLEKSFSYNETGKLAEAHHIKFNRTNGLNAQDIVSYVYGSSKTSSLATEIGLAYQTTVEARSNFRRE